MAEAHSKIPADARYVSYECAFKGKDGKKCDYKTAVDTRKKADSQLYEHWTVHHKLEYDKMQNEAERKRIDADHKREKELEAEKMKEKEDQERVLFKARARGIILIIITYAIKKKN